MKPRRRFTEHGALDPQNVVGLAIDHPAMLEQRTLYPSTVVAPIDSPRLLVSGVNQRKLGSQIVKGRWRGMPLYALTLEERATCPETCPQQSVCYGNGMHMARRHMVDTSFAPLLHVEIKELSQKHPDGFAIRLHVLGDFASLTYVWLWREFLAKYPALHVCGFTAWAPDTMIGRQVHFLNLAFSQQCYIRPSGIETRVVCSPDPELIMCPAQTDKTDCCGTCGLCWATSMQGKVVGFLKHSKKGKGQ